MFAYQSILNDFFVKVEVILPWATLEVQVRVIIEYRERGETGALPRGVCVMLNFYKNIDGKVKPIKTFEEGCWIHAVAPTEKELFNLTAELGLGQNMLRAAVDEDEMSRIDVGVNQTLIVLRLPCSEKKNTIVSYYAVPVGVIIAEKCIVTVTGRDNTLISEFVNGIVKNVQVTQKSRFVLQIAARMAARYLQNLRQIDKVSLYIEKRISGTLNNTEIVQLYELRKSLMRFAVSLKSNEITMEKLLRGRVIRLNPEDEELLEDALTEVKQASDMAAAYSGIEDITLDSMKTVISNNRNSQVKRTQIIAAALLAPVAVFGFYSANVTALPFRNAWFVLGIGLFASVAAAYIVHKNHK